MNQAALRAHLRVNDPEFKMSPVSMVEFFTRGFNHFYISRELGFVRVVFSLTECDTKRKGQGISGVPKSVITT